MLLDKGLRAQVIAATVNSGMSMEYRKPTPTAIRQRNSERLRELLQAKQGRPVLNVPRLIGGAILLLAFLLIVIGAASAHEFSSNGVTVSHPWARATPGGVKVGGAYLEIKATGSGDRLIGASSPAAGTVEVHSHEMQNGVARMRRVEALPIKGGTSVVLKPGGYHVMLMDLKQPLKEGDTLKLTLAFERAGNIEVEATIEPVAATGPHGLPTQPGHEHDKPDTGTAGGHHH